MHAEPRLAQHQLKLKSIVFKRGPPRAPQKSPWETPLRLFPRLQDPLGQSARTLAALEASEAQGRAAAAHGSTSSQRVQCPRTTSPWMTRSLTCSLAPSQLVSPSGHASFFGAHCTPFKLDTGTAPYVSIEK